MRRKSDSTMQRPRYDLNLISILVFVNLNRWVIGYSDLRAIPCMSPHLGTKIPATRSNWSGKIVMRIQCEPGHDVALNTPNHYECLPDRSPWKPSVIPDCMGEMIPEWLNIVALLKVPANQCKKDGSKYSMETVRGKLKSLCDPLLFNHCSVRNVTSFCSGLPENPSIETEYWAQEIGVQAPFIVQIVIRMLYDKRRHYTFYIKNRKPLVDRLVQAVHGDVSTVKKILLKAECPSGAVPVGRIEDGKIVCRGCSLGHRMDFSKKQCQMCRGGYYQDNQLSTSCKICPAMRTLKDQKIWAEIKTRVPQGAYAISFCPTLNMRADGSLVLVMPARTIGYKNYPEPLSPGAKKASRTGSFADNLNQMTITCLFLGGLFVVEGT